MILDQYAQIKNVMQTLLFVKKKLVHVEKNINSVSLHKHKQSLKISPPKFNRLKISKNPSRIILTNLSTKYQTREKKYYCKLMHLSNFMV